MPFSRLHLSKRLTGITRYGRTALDFALRHKRIGFGVGAVALVLLLTGAVLGGRYAAGVFAGLPDRQQLTKLGQMAQATRILDRDGETVFTLSREERIEVPLSRVSPHMVQALLAIEDQRFYEHGGVDIVRLLGAAWANLRQGRAAQGGSTLTQQLARQAFLTPDKTLQRKLREMVLARRIEQLFSKREILQLYLNKVYFGNGLYGVEAASRGYFAKSASDLSVSEAALLAGLVKSPSGYAPTVNLERAVVRRNVVLKEMLDGRLMSREAFDKARAENVELRDALRRDEPWGQHFKEHVRQELVQRFGVERVFEGGLRVVTTLDRRMQQEAEEAVSKALADLDGRRKKLAVRVRKASAAAAPPDSGEPLEAALVAIDPATGEVRALVGGRDFGTSRFNRATQARRQPGSAFKPLVFAAALEYGFTPASMLDRLDDPVMTPEGPWVPEDEHLESGAMTLRTALRTSSNRAAVRLLQEVGIPRTVDYAQRVGLGNMPSVPSLALGSGEVTLLSLASAYLPFANGGLTRPPSFVKKVEDRDGRVLYEATVSETRVISEQTAFQMAHMLADVVNAGTAYGARRLGFTLPAAGKTGTTNDYADAWFVGFTPKLLTGVWVGFDQPRTIIRDGYAGDVAVPLWARFMVAATKGDKASWYTPPKGLVGARVCRLSGQLATPGCDQVPTLTDAGEFRMRALSYTEYFVRGTEPAGYCQLHAHVSLDRYAGPVVVPDDGGLPSALDAPPPATAAAGTTGAATAAGAPAAAAAEKASEPQKKKGFWGKVWGAIKGGDDKKKDPKKDEKGR
jgi:penicillin-binding protein 1A